MTQNHHGPMPASELCSGTQSKMWGLRALSPFSVPSIPFPAALFHTPSHLQPHIPDTTPTSCRDMARELGMCYPSRACSFKVDAEGGSSSKRKNWFPTLECLHLLKVICYYWQWKYYNLWLGMFWKTGINSGSSLKPHPSDLKVICILDGRERVARQLVHW